MDVKEESKAVVKKFLTETKLSDSSTQDLVDSLNEYQKLERLTTKRCLCPVCYRENNYDIRSGSLLLEASREALEKSLEDFKKKIAEESRFRELRQSGILDKKDLTIKDLRKEIEAAIARWKSEESRLARYFHIFCDKIYSHENLLSLLPSQSIYASVFCGVLTIIVKTSVTYRHTCAGFAQALKEITDDISSVDHAFDRSPRVRALACDLYAAFFSFMAEALKWFSDRCSKRFWNAVTQDIHSDLSSSIENVRRIAGLIDRHQQIKHNILCIYMHQYTHGMLTQLEDSQARFQERFTKEVTENLVQAVLKLLHDKAERNIIETRYQGRSKVLSPVTPDEPPDLALISESSVHSEVKGIISVESSPSISLTENAAIYDEKHLQTWSTPLAQFIIANPLNFIEHDTSGWPEAEEAVLEVLESWLAARSSKSLWIQTDSSSGEYPTSLSDIAAGIVEIALELRIPVLVFFCDWPDEYPGTTIANQERKCFADLICSLIRQLIQVLPEEQIGWNKFSKGQFQALVSLCGELDTVAAVKLFHDLLQCAPTLLFIVLDGLEHLQDTEDTSVSEEMMRLTELLGNFMQGGQQEISDRVVKLLLTTSGDCEAVENLQMQLGEDIADSVVMTGAGKGLSPVLPLDYVFDSNNQDDDE